MGNGNACVRRQGEYEVDRGGNQFWLGVWSSKVKNLSRTGRIAINKRIWHYGASLDER